MKKPKLKLLVKKDWSYKQNSSKFFLRPRYLTDTSRRNMKKEEEKKQPERKPESDNVHTIELKPQKKITSEDIKKDGKKDEDEEDEDMFNDTFVVKKNDGAAARGDIIEDAADKDGYYVIRSGELLDGRYKVMSSQGKGVYSNVVRAKDAKQSDLVVAIKIVRNIELM